MAKRGRPSNAEREQQRLDGLLNSIRQTHKDKYDDGRETITSLDGPIATDDGNHGANGRVIVNEHHAGSGRGDEHVGPSTGSAASERGPVPAATGTNSGSGRTIGAAAPDSGSADRNVSPAAWNRAERLENIGFEPLPGDDIPIEPEVTVKRGRGRPRKETTENREPVVEIPVSKFFSRKAKETNPFSERDAEKIRPRLVETIKQFGYYWDEMRAPFLRSKEVVIIWGDLDDDEAGILADLWLRRAKKRGISARNIERAVDFYETKIKLAAIVLPRMVREWRTYMSEGVSWPR